MKPIETPKEYYLLDKEAFDRLVNDLIEAAARGMEPGIERFIGRIKRAILDGFLDLYPNGDMVLHKEPSLELPEGQQVDPIALLEKVKNEIPDAHFPELGCSPHKALDELISEHSPITSNRV